MPILRPVYQAIVDEIDEVSPAWIPQNFHFFSQSKELFEHQVNALNNIIKLLWCFYGDTPHEDINVIKERFYERVVNVEPLISKLGINEGSPTFQVIRNYYPVEYTGRKRRISFRNFVNRAGFWMATGSGKTLIIVKLVELLDYLMRIGKIPLGKIMILSSRDDLINQVIRHIEEYNADHGRKIRFYELSDRNSLESRLEESSINVFVYRSDLISDDTGKKVISFLEVDNGGKWYIILDEAHKGDKEDSRRQVYLSYLTRNGFLFNFSATFTDPWDIVTTVYNFNLTKFINSGYGKEIFVLGGNIGNVGELSERDKIKTVIKSLIILTATKKELEKIREKGLTYHEPLLVVLGNSVNKRNSDLEIFFRTLGKIATLPDREIYETSLLELMEELKGSRYEIGNISYEDVLWYVFNTRAPGEIEVIRIPENSKELVFKLKTSSRPFAMIKIGDISKWLTYKLSGYYVSQTYKDESFFSTLNENSVNILLGSRSFYEGWDSNRPNVMLFLNIGKGDAKKYVLQSLGRGERIEPVKGIRKRLRFAHDFQKVEGVDVSFLETLFVMATDADNVRRILESIDFDRKITALEEKIPLYLPYVKRKKGRELKVNCASVKEFVEWIGDKKVLYAIYSDFATPHDIEVLMKLLSNCDSAGFSDENRGESKEGVGTGDPYYDTLNLLLEIRGSRENSREVISLKKIALLKNEIRDEQVLSHFVKFKPFPSVGIRREELNENEMVFVRILESCLNQRSDLKKATWYFSSYERVKAFSEIVFDFILWVSRINEYRTIIINPKLSEIPFEENKKVELVNLKSAEEICEKINDID
ncbi:hypothetical protein HS7_00800 [Sulfolobales archaeon HS-7]|nr:hypothetical protein HS7_00800 [Sulfolobales archaeon HS-7]